MGKVASTLAKPFQGISQQTDDIAIEGRARIVDNMDMNPRKGASKRKGTNRIAEVGTSNVRVFAQGTTIPADSKVHHYTRDSDTGFFIVVNTPLSGSPTITVFDNDGVTQTVSAAAGPLAYLATTGKLSEQIVMETIGDTTFLVNRETEVEISTDLSTDSPVGGVVYSQFANFGKTYEIYINETLEASYKTPDGTSAGDADKTDTTFIIDQLVIDLTAGTFSGVWTVAQEGNTVAILSGPSSIDTIETKDGVEGSDLISLHISIDDIAKLPKVLPTNFVKTNGHTGLILRVQGRGVSENLSYWLEANPQDEDLAGSDINVIWKEVPKPGEKYKFDAGTMPHALTFDGVSTFTLDEAAWLNRQNGSLESTPFPSFADLDDATNINAISLVQNRLVFSSRETNSMSVSGSFFDFFRESAQFTTATDPIDIFADVLQLNTILKSEKLDGDFIYFSANGQFLIPGNVPLSTSTTTMSQVGSYRTLENVNIVSAGDRIFFPFSQGEFTGIKEFLTDKVTGKRTAIDITEQCPAYIIGAARLMVIDTNKNILIVLAEDDDTLYIYNWLEDTQGIIQQAWHRWTFSGKVIKHVVISEDKIRILINRDDGLFLEEIPTGDPDDLGISFNARADSKEFVTAYKNGEDWQWQALPSSDDDLLLDFIRATGSYEEEAGVSVDRTLDASVPVITAWNVASGSHPIVDFVDGSEGTVNEYGDQGAGPTTINAFTIKSDAIALGLADGQTRVYEVEIKFRLETSSAGSALIFSVTDLVGCSLTAPGSTSTVNLTTSWVTVKLFVTVLASAGTQSFKLSIGGLPAIFGLTESMYFTDASIQSPIWSTREDLGAGSTVQLIKGIPYTSEFKPINPVVRDFRDRPIGADQLTMSRFYANMEETGYCKATVTHDSGAEYTSLYTGRVVGGDNPFGFRELSDSVFQFGVGAKAKEASIVFSSDLQFPMTINSIEWKGKFTQRGRRV